MRVLAAVFQVRLPTLILLLPPHPFFRSQLLLSHPGKIGRDLGTARKVGIIFEVISDFWKKLNDLKTCSGIREPRGHWQEDRRVLSGIMQLGFLSSFPDLGVR